MRRQRRPGQQRDFAISRAEKSHSRLIPMAAESAGFARMKKQRYRNERISFEAALARSLAA
jgi:hypothetical protein